MTELPMLWVWALARARVLNENGDRGDGILVWVVMTALLVAAAIVIVAIIVSKARSTASNTKTQ